MYPKSNRQVVGTCGNCGGAVTLPIFYMSVIPPVPTCEECGATVRPHGPVLPMNPPRRIWTGDRTTGPSCCA